MNLHNTEDGHSEGFWSEHWNDANGNPAGGVSTGTGFTISWQNGPLGTGNERKRANGAFVEDIIAAAIDRIAYYQASKFNCQENGSAGYHLQMALGYLKERTKNRNARNVEGTHAK